MKQAIRKKMDNGNRVLIPTDFLEQLDIDKNSSVLVVKDDNDDFIRIYNVNKDQEEK